MQNFEKFRLQKYSGLTNQDPLHEFLGLMDEFEEVNWVEIFEDEKTNADNLFFFFQGAWHTKTKENDPLLTNALTNYQNYLQGNELVTVIQKLRNNIGYYKLTERGILSILMWLIANKDLLTEKYFEAKREFKQRGFWYRKK